MKPKSLYRPSLLIAAMSILGATLCLPDTAIAQQAPASDKKAKPQASAPQARPTQRIVNRIAATVNGRPITSSEVRIRLMPLMQQLQGKYPQQGPDFINELIDAKSTVIDELVERELVLSEFGLKGYQMPEQQVDEEINNRVLMRFNGKRKHLIDGLRKSGMSYSDYRQSVRKEITVGAMRRTRYDRDLPPTPDELKAEYRRSRQEYRDPTMDSVQFDKIFIPVATSDPNVSPEEQHALAVEVANKLHSKQISFSDAAKKYSSDMHAKDGGSWPYVKRLDLAVNFAGVVFTAKPGTIVGPLYDSHGFTIVKVVNVREAAAPSLSKPEVKKMVDAAVRRNKSEKRYRQWVERLRDKAIIRKFI